MATVYVTLPPSNNGHPRPDAVDIDVGGEKLKAIAVDIGDARLNLIQAAARGGVEVPYFCWHPALTVVAEDGLVLESGPVVAPTPADGNEPRPIA